MPRPFYAAPTMIELNAGAGIVAASATLAMCYIPCQIAAAEDTPAPAARVEITDMDSHASFGGPGSVVSQIDADEKPKASIFDHDAVPGNLQPYDDFKARLREEHANAGASRYSLSGNL